jgi:hypothetical protein
MKLPEASGKSAARAFAAVVVTVSGSQAKFRERRRGVLARSFQTKPYAKINAPIPLSPEPMTFG